MAGYFADNIFTAIIDEQGVIWEAGTGRKRQAVGIDAQKEQEYQAQISEMQGVIDNYYNRLVELGEINPPKSADQIAQEQAAQQAEINQALLEAISSLKSELGELRNGDSRNSNESSINPIQQDSQNNRKAPRGSKGSDKPGPEDAA